MNEQPSTSQQPKITSETILKCGHCRVKNIFKDFRKELNGKSVTEPGTGEKKKYSPTDFFFPCCNTIAAYTVTGANDDIVIVKKRMPTEIVEK